MLFLAAFLPELGTLEGEVVGVGLVESAIGTTRVLSSRRAGDVAHVVLVGTVGAYPNSGLSIGDVVACESIALAAASGALVEGAMPTSIETDRALTECFAAKRARVATTLTITTDDDVACELERTTRAHVEHLEAFAVARACAVANVPFTAIFGVANIVGSRGREAWRANHERAAAAARDVIKNRATRPLRA